MFLWAYSFRAEALCPKSSYLIEYAGFAKDFGIRREDIISAIAVGQKTLRTVFVLTNVRAGLLVTLRRISDRVFSVLQALRVPAHQLWFCARGLWPLPESTALPNRLEQP